MPGYQASDANISMQKGIPTYTTKLTAKSSKEGKEPITFTVTISCTNVKESFKDAMDVVEKYRSLSKKDRKNYNKALNISLEALIGATKFIPPDEITEGLIGDDLKQGLSAIWKDYADNVFKYTIECEAPGKDHGKIANQSLSSISKLIPEYLKLVELTTQVASLKIDEHKFILPLIFEIQGMLKDWYESIYAEGKMIIDEEEEDTENQSEDTQRQDEAQQSTDNSQEQGDSTVDSSKELKITLSKIVGSNEIELKGFISNYAPKQSLEDLDEILSLPEFVALVNEDTQTFKINPNPEDFTVNAIEEVEIDPYTGLTDLLKYGIDTYRQLYLLHWMACGNDMMKLHDLCQEFYEELIQEIDTLGELIVEKTGSVINPQEICSDNILEVKKFTYQEGLSILSSLISYYIDLIDYIYINQSSDVQSILDDWLRYWNKQLNYFIKNQEEM
jgi:DNA-binding ferritin-like protein